MTPFTRTTVATGAAFLLVAGSALTLAGPAWGATPPVPTPAATDAPAAGSPEAGTDGPDAPSTDEPAAPTTPISPSAPVAPAAPVPSVAPGAPVPTDTPADGSGDVESDPREPSSSATAEPTARADAGPAPAPVPEVVPAPDPTDPPNPDDTQITLRGNGDPERYETRERFFIVGEAGPLTEIRVLDQAGNLIAFDYSDSDGTFYLAVTYPQDAYTKQTVTVTSSFEGDLISSVQTSFNLTPPTMEMVGLSSPAAGQTVTGPGALIDVPFTGTGVAGARVEVLGYPFAGVREAGLDGDYAPEIVHDTVVGSDGTWATTLQLEPGAYSFKARQMLDAPASSPYFPYLGFDWGVEYRDLYVTSSTPSGATLPETGAPSSTLPTLSMLLLGAGTAGMLIARRRSEQSARGQTARG
jgi:hypothetical protein